LLLLKHHTVFAFFMAYTYILQSETTGMYYVGSCNDVQERLRRHNSGHSLSTRKGIPWKIVYQKEFETKQEAMRKEYRIKSMKSRKYIEKLITE
jgi:putative endonuclease